MKTTLKEWRRRLLLKDRPDEYEAKRLLGLFNISTPEGYRLFSEDRVTLPGPPPPYVAKVCSAEIQHKTDLDGVLLDLDDRSLTGGITELRKRFPGSPILIEEQIRFKGPEFIVGALVDPDFGPAVMVGAGGILTELYKDVVFRLAPCPPREALCMLRELIVAPVLSSFRGFDLNEEGLARIISVVGDLTIALGDLFGQLDINPMVYSAGQWIALDAKLVLVE